MRPVRDVYAAGPGPGGGWLTHSRRFSATGAGTRVDEQVDWDTGLPGVLGGLVDQLVLRRRVLRAMQAHLDAYAAAAARRALDVLQVVGAAIVDGDARARRPALGRALRRLWEFPGGKVERGESDLSALVRECAEELGVAIAPQAFVGEVLAGRRRRRRRAGRVDAAGVVGPDRERASRSRTSTPRSAGWAPTSSRTSTGSRPTAPCSPPSAPSSPAPDPTSRFRYRKRGLRRRFRYRKRARGVRREGLWTATGPRPAVPHACRGELIEAGSHGVFLGSHAVAVRARHPGATAVGLVPAAVPQRLRRSAASGGPPVVCARGDARHAGDAVLGGRSAAAWFGAPFAGPTEPVLAVVPP